MLGRHVSRGLLARGFDVVSVSRSSGLTPASEHEVLVFDISKDDPEGLFARMEHADFVVNCAGVLKGDLAAGELREMERAVKVNAVFPHKLRAASERLGFKLLQIATDCVFDGRRGHYSERDLHTPDDFYGVSKSSGEIEGGNVLQLRCSIIGAEVGNRRSLVEWVRSRQTNTSVPGFVDHRWNGVTAEAFARVATALAGQLSNSLSFLSGTFHFLPADEVTKSELVSRIAERLDREDITVRDTVSGRTVDRTLTTIHPDVNSEMWSLAGYSAPPAITDLVQAMPRKID